MAPTKSGSLLACAAIAVCFAAAWRHRDAADDRTFGDPAVILSLADKEIDESSGVARSHAFPGRYCTHNDSGDSARFWRFDLKGTIEGPFSVAAAAAVDWEDMASAKIGGTSYLYFGDVGDNLRRRKDVCVYRIEEPTGRDKSSGKADAYVLSYPDKPHNAEALLVHPATGEMQIVTKEETGESLVFSLPGSARAGAHVLKLVGKVRLASPLPGGQLVTGGDISEDGKHVVLRTYLAAYEFEVSGGFQSWLKSKPRTIRLALEPQGEAIGYSLDGKSLVTTSEHSPCQVSKVEIGG